VVGAAYVVAGIALLLHQLGLVTLRWTMLLPSLLVVVGAGLLVAGAVGARADHPAGPGRGATP
jgi:hypothetical protein